MDALVYSVGTVHRGDYSGCKIFNLSGEYDDDKSYAIVSCENYSIQLNKDKNYSIVARLNTASVESFTYLGSETSSDKGSFGRILAGAVLAGTVGAIIGVSVGSETTWQTLAINFRDGKSCIIKVHDKAFQEIQMDLYQTSIMQTNNEKIQENNEGQRKEIKKIAVTSDNFKSILERIDLFLEDEKWEDAALYCDSALDYAPQSAEVYLRYLLSDLKLDSVDKLAECDLSYQENDYYKKTIRFADDDLKQKLDNYITAQICKKRDKESKIEEKSINVVSALKKMCCESRATFFKHKKDNYIDELEKIKKLIFRADDISKKNKMF